MRREQPDLPYSNARPVVYDHSDDSDISYSGGRAYRRESSRHDPDNTITPAEQKLLHQRRLEAAEARRAEVERNLALIPQVGAALRVLVGEG